MKGASFSSRTLALQGGVLVCSHGFQFVLVLPILHLSSLLPALTFTETVSAVFTIVCQTLPSNYFFDETLTDTEGRKVFVHYSLPLVPPRALYPPFHPGPLFSVYENGVALASPLKSPIIYTDTFKAVFSFAVLNNLAKRISETKP